GEQILAQEVDRLLLRFERAVVIQLLHDAASRLLTFSHSRHQTLAQRFDELRLISVLRRRRRLAPGQHIDQKIRDLHRRTAAPLATIRLQQADGMIERGAEAIAALAELAERAQQIDALGEIGSLRIEDAHDREILIERAPPLFDVIARTD